MSRSPYVLAKAETVLPSFSSAARFDEDLAARLNAIYTLDDETKPATDYSAVPQDRDATHSRPHRRTDPRYRFIEELLIVTRRLYELAGEQHQNRSHIASFYHNMQADINYYEISTGAANHFYSAVKATLERLMLRIEKLQQKNEITAVNRALKEINDAIGVCGPGLFTRLQDIEYQLSSQASIESWLGDMRRTIVRQIGDAHCERKGIYSGNTVHVHSSLKKRAHQQGFLLPDGAQFLDLEDRFEELAEITPEEEKTYLSEMRQRFTYEAICEEITARYRDLFFLYQNKAAALHVMTENLQTEIDALPEDERAELQRQKAQLLAQRDTELAGTLLELDSANLSDPTRLSAFMKICKPFIDHKVFTIDDIIVVNETTYTNTYLHPKFMERLSTYIKALLHRQAYVQSPELAAIQSCWQSTADGSQPSLRVAYLESSTNHSKLDQITAIEGELKLIADLGTAAGIDPRGTNPICTHQQQVKAAIFTLFQARLQLRAQQGRFRRLLRIRTKLDRLLTRHIQHLKTQLHLPDGTSLTIEQCQASHQAVMNLHRLEQKQTAEHSAAIKIQAIIRRQQAQRELETLQQQTRAARTITQIIRRRANQSPKFKALRYCQALMDCMQPSPHAPARIKRAYTIAFGQDIFGLPLSQFGDGHGIAITRQPPSALGEATTTGMQGSAPFPGEPATTIENVASHLCLLGNSESVYLESSVAQLTGEEGLIMHPSTGEPVQRTSITSEHVDITVLNTLFNLRRIHELIKTNQIIVPLKHIKPNTLQALIQLHPELISAEFLQPLFSEMDEINLEIINRINQLHQSSYHIDIIFAKLATGAQSYQPPSAGTGCGGTAAAEESKMDDGDPPATIYFKRLKHYLIETALNMNELACYQVGEARHVHQQSHDSINRLFIALSEHYPNNSAPQSLETVALLIEMARIIIKPMTTNPSQRRYFLFHREASDYLQSMLTEMGMSDFSKYSTVLSQPSHLRKTFHRNPDKTVEKVITRTPISAYLSTNPVGELGAFTFST